MNKLSSTLSPLGMQENNVTSQNTSAIHSSLKTPTHSYFKPNPRETLMRVIPAHPGYYHYHYDHPRSGIFRQDGILITVISGKSGGVRLLL